MLQLWENAETEYFLGVKVYAFGLYCALGAALGLIALALLLRRRRWKQGTAALTGVLAILCGFALSHGLFCLLDRSVPWPLGLGGLLILNGGGHSMVGALAGACLGGVLAAKITGQSPARLLDFLAPALMLFVACERLGEGYIEDFGISRPLVGNLFKGSFLAVQGPYAWYLATYLVESFAALALATALLRDENESRRPGDTFLLCLMLYGASQILLESLRSDQHMHWSYVGLQQVFAFAMLGAGVLLPAFRCWKARRRLALGALIATGIALALSILMEFIIYRTEINRYLLYAVFAAILAVPVLFGVKLRKEGQAAWTSGI